MEEYSPRKIYSSCYSKHWTVRLQAEGEENNKKEEQIEAEKDEKPCAIVDELDKKVF